MISATNGHIPVQKRSNGSAEGNSPESRTPVGEPETSPTSTPTSSPLSAETSQRGARGEPARETARDTIVDAVDELTITDRKSFIQNVVGTVAFKMLEWLTPRNLEIMAIEGAGEGDLLKDQPASRETCTPLISKNPEKIVEESSKPRGPTNKNSVNRHREDVEIATSEEHDQPKLPPPSKEKPIPNSVAPETPSNTAAVRPLSPTLRRKSKQNETQLPKGILSFSTSPPTADMTSNIEPRIREALNPITRKKSQQNLVGSKIRVPKIAPTYNIAKPVANGKPVEVPPSKPIEAHNSEPEFNEASKKSPIQYSNYSELEGKPSITVEPQQTSLPQSLGCLSVELIDFVCDILQMDGKSERHSLHPAALEPSLRHDSWMQMNTLRQFFSENQPSASSRAEWRKFIEQSLFDVLSRPESLVKSFTCHGSNRFFDAQSIWYLMLRMTRVAPSLVLDSLWIVSGNLFHSPEKIEHVYEWPKETSSRVNSSNKNLSNVDATQVLTVCLHALVATAPLVTDARRLANMSRIRSYGLTMLGRNMASLEPVALCLQYDDAFTNDFALRLARRIFAAIPTRRRFAELLELQHETRIEEGRAVDILDGILASLTSLETTPVMQFSAEERMLHEARVPVLILDWARTIMLQDWQGIAEVPSEGSFGGALAMMAAICELFQCPLHY